MNINRFLAAYVAVYVSYQVIAYLTHAVWLGATYGSLSSVWRPEAELLSKQWIMFVTSAVWSFFFCYIFVKGYENKGVLEGVRYGAIIGLFYAIPQAYDNYAVLPIPYFLAFRWFLSGLFGSMVMGAVAAAIYKPAK